MPYLVRHAALTAIMALALAIPPLSATAAQAKAGFSMETVRALAADLASRPYQEPAKVPDFLLSMSYDAWRDIRFKPEMSLWRGEKLPFIVQFFHPGLFYDRAVAINEVQGGRVSRLTSSPEQFTYGRNDFAAKVQPGLGYAGFRIHHPINRRDYYDEVAVFLGASYVRAVGRDMTYGLSARGLAVDTALPSGEEFPWFREFWLEKPGRLATSMIVYALLDSPSLAGAYRFVIKPGRETVIEVEAAIYRRKDVKLLGLAPLTSMFFYGENTAVRPVDDFRPEVHDSDGLLLANSTGEWLWRPLMNPPYLLVSSFSAVDPLGFGLLQRDLSFDSYQDMEARYERRPSVWIEPRGKWGEGRVELIQIPTDSEYNDNITAFWVPTSLPDPGQPLTLSYAMSWHMPVKGRPPGGRVMATRTARGRDDHTRLFMIDFIGGDLEKVAPNKALTPVITVGDRGRIVEHQLSRNSHTGGWRLTFQVRLDDQTALERVLPNKRPPPLELRAFLKDGDNVLTETWSYAYPP